MKSIFADSVFPIKLLRDFFIVNPLQKEKIKANIDYSFIPMKNISDKNAVVKQTNIIKGKDSKGYTSFNDGDFVFAKITPCMENGKMAIIRNLPTHIGFGSTEFHVFREKTNAVTVDFLRSIFLINDFRKYAKCYFTGTAGHQRVPSEFFQSLKIPIPPKNIQADIVAKMERAYQDMRIFF
jgi:type I restriction enzyme S subunit